MALPTSELFNRYHFSDILGEGQSGRIWRCQDRITGETLACKQVRKRGMSHVELADLRREVQAMLILRGHPNVLCLRGLYEDDKAVYMITELCAGGDLFALIAEHEGLEESVAARLFLQLARAVRWCHINRVVHRDIKPENILIVPPAAAVSPAKRGGKSRFSDNDSSSPLSSPASSDGDATGKSQRLEDLQLRLADFGLAFPLQPGSAIIGAAGSAPYEAPEVLAHEPYNYCADIWSLGVLLYAMLSANWPAFPDDNRKLLPSDLLPKPWPSISFEAKDLIRRMLTTDPMERIDIIGVLEHPWLKKQLAPPQLEAPSHAPSHTSSGSYKLMALSIGSGGKGGMGAAGGERGKDGGESTRGGEERGKEGGVGAGGAAKAAWVAGAAGFGGRKDGGAEGSGKGGERKGEEARKGTGGGGGGGAGGGSEGSGGAREREGRERGEDGDRDEGGTRSMSGYRNPIAHDDDDDDAAVRFPDAVTDFRLETAAKELYSFYRLPLYKKWSPSLLKESVYLRGKDANGGAPVFVDVVAWRVVVKVDSVKVQVQARHGEKWVEVRKPSLGYASGRLGSEIGWAECCVRFHPDWSEGEVKQFLRTGLDRAGSYKAGLDGAGSGKAGMLRKKRRVARFLEEEEEDEEEKDRRFIASDDEDEGEMDVGGGVGGSSRGGGRAGDARYRSWKEGGAEDGEGEGSEEGLEEGAEEGLYEGEEEEEEDEQVAGWDSVCYICDDGGDLVCCDGPCMRSFHVEPDSEEEKRRDKFHCPTIGLPDSEVHEKETWLCPNCEAKQHVCFICHQLGRSEPVLGGNSGVEGGGEGNQQGNQQGQQGQQGQQQVLQEQEVFMCDVALCGHFYHPTCVASWLADSKRLPQGSEERIKELETVAGNIRAGSGMFFCPLHTCAKCQLGEGDLDSFKLVPCRRCPKSFHSRKGGLTHKEMAQSWNKGKAPRHMFQYPCDLDASRARLSKIFEAAAKQVTEQTAKAGLAVPRMYQHCHNSAGSGSGGNAGGSAGGGSNNAGGNPRKIALSKLESILHAGEKARNFLAKELEQAGMVSAQALQQAMGLCPKMQLQQLNVIGGTLRVYLSPYVHGQRYTSFGRHFTMPEKLNEVVERLVPYMEDGDVLVDFCCGANHFSLIARHRLEEAGKRCGFANFDIMRPPNEFCFVKRDWFSVKRNQLPHRDRLIMGLNPPFGVRGHLASNFSSRAASVYRPKLIILIVPPETRQLGPLGYTLLWKDEKIFENRAFYLPGSHDKDNKTMNQWNNIPPPLYLWCRNDLVHIYGPLADRLGHTRGLFSSPRPMPPSLLAELRVATSISTTGLDPASIAAAKSQALVLLGPNIWARAGCGLAEARASGDDFGGADEGGGVAGGDGSGGGDGDDATAGAAVGNGDGGQQLYLEERENEGEEMVGLDVLGIDKGGGGGEGELEGRKLGGLKQLRREEEEDMNAKRIVKVKREFEIMGDKGVGDTGRDRGGHYDRDGRRSAERGAGGWLEREGDRGVERGGDGSQYDAREREQRLYRRGRDVDGREEREGGYEERGGGRRGDEAWNERGERGYGDREERGQREQDEGAYREGGYWEGCPHPPMFVSSQISGAIRVPISFDQPLGSALSGANSVPLGRVVSAVPPGFGPDEGEGSLRQQE
ncbi:unnamed protein product, partial [Closterium sp. Yama58-4]